MFKWYFQWLDKFKIGIDTEKNVTLLLCQAIANTANIAFTLLFGIDFNPSINLTFAFIFLYRFKCISERNHIKWSAYVPNNKDSDERENQN